MWPAKLPGEGALLYDTCAAMSEVMKELGVAVDGGKDSLSMAARVGSDTVKAPGKQSLILENIKFLGIQFYLRFCRYSYTESHISDILVTYLT